MSFLQSLRNFFSFLSAFKRLFISPRDYRILVLGLDAAGKTTLLYKLKIAETVHTIPTIGFNVESLEYRNIHFTMWDIGGQEKIRPLWKHYYHNTDALIYVVDSNDGERMRDAADELQKMLSQDELANTVLLVFANKQDLPQAMSTAEIAQSLGLNDIRNRPWLIQASSATSGDGLYEGLDWMSNAVLKLKS